MAIVLERHVTREAGRPPDADGGWEHPRLDVFVVFTSVETTIAALKRAGSLAKAAACGITLLVPQIVPYPVPLTSPPVLIDWTERRFRVIAEASPVDTKVVLCLCRDRDDALRQILGRRSPVVLGARRTWWPFTPERRLAGKLRRSGYQVVFVETE